MILDVEGTRYRGIATSGSSERGDHIWPAPNSTTKSEYLQVTVAATDLVTADIWATAIVSGGQLAFELFEAKVDKQTAVAIATSAEGRVQSSNGFASILANLG